MSSAQKSKQLRFWPRLSEKQKIPQDVSKYQNDQNQSWDELQNYEMNKNLQLRSGEIKKQLSRAKNKPNIKKATEIQHYEQALKQLRKETKRFYNPFQRQRLNISVVQTIKILDDAIQKDSGYEQTLRKLGCKLKMRVRSHTATVQLFQAMKQYLQTGSILSQMKLHHQELLLRADGEFQEFPTNNLYFQQHTYTYKTKWEITRCRCRCTQPGALPVSLFLAHGQLILTDS